MSAQDPTPKAAISGFWTRISARVVLTLGFAYAASWWADQRFYAQFGIAPQDIGLTPSGGLSDIIGAVVRLGLWVALALVVLAGLPAVAVSAAGFALEAPASEGQRRRTLAWAFAAAAAITAFLGYGWLAGWIYAAAAAAVLLLAVSVWWFLSPTRQHPTGQQPSKTRPTWPATLETFSKARTSWAIKVLDVFSIIAVVGLLLVDLPDDASRAANCAVKTPGYAVRGIGAPLSFVHLILLDVYAQPATITWIGTPPASIDQNPFRGIFLGTSGATAIIYEQADPPRLLRLPASEITMILNPTAPTCKAAH